MNKKSWTVPAFFIDVIRLIYYIVLKINYIKKACPKKSRPLLTYEKHQGQRYRFNYILSIP